jgi:hypothetical protein
MMNKKSWLATSLIVVVLVLVGLASASEETTEWTITLDSNEYIIHTNGAIDMAFESPTDDYPVDITADAFFKHVRDDSTDIFENTNLRDADEVDDYSYQVSTTVDEGDALRVKVACSEVVWVNTNNGRLNLRDEPNGQIADRVNRGQQLTTTGITQGDWIQVVYNNNTYWVLSTYVTNTPVSNTGGNGGSGTSGSSGESNCPTQWTGAFVSELGVGGSSFQSGTYGIVQWYRPGGTGDGAFLAFGGIDLPDDISGSIWWLPGATKSQAECLLAVDPVALQYGIEAP